MTSQPYSEGLTEGVLIDGQLFLTQEPLISEDYENRYRVRSYGRLSGIEIIFPEPVENIDEANPYFIEVRVWRHDGSEPYPRAVVAHVCEITDERDAIVSPRP